MRRRELHAPRFVRFKLSGASRLDGQILWYLQRESEKGNVQACFSTRKRKTKQIKGERWKDKKRKKRNTPEGKRNKREIEIQKERDYSNVENREDKNFVVLPVEF